MSCNDSVVTNVNCRENVDTILGELSGTVDITIDSDKTIVIDFWHIS